VSGACEPGDGSLASFITGDPNDGWFVMVSGASAGTCHVEIDFSIGSYSADVTFVVQAEVPPEGCPVMCASVLLPTPASFVVDDPACGDAGLADGG
jgi:hypothetical protein